MSITLRLVRRIFILPERYYCVSKVPPPGSNPNRARKIPWSPYDDIVHEKDSGYIEDVMEFRTGSDEPFKREKGRRGALMRFSENLSRKWTRGFKLEESLRRKQRAFLVDDQKYNPERVKVLGPDLAVAHFFCARGGGVKFVGEHGFIQPGRNKSHSVLPPYRDDRFKVEAINAVNYNLIYEGLAILGELESLRWISLKGNTEFDNWCMDRLSLVAPHLEFINLSGCRKIDHNAFACLYRLKKLRCVCVEDTVQSDSFKLTCLTLESENPNLVFLGLQLKTPKKSVFNS